MFKNIDDGLAKLAINNIERTFEVRGNNGEKEEGLGLDEAMEHAQALADKTGAATTVFCKGASYPSAVKKPKGGFWSWEALDARYPAVCRVMPELIDRIVVLGSINNGQEKKMMILDAACKLAEDVGMAAEYAKTHLDEACRQLGV